MTELQQIYISLLDDDNDEVREAGAKGLYGLLDSSVVEALLEILSKKKHPGLMETIWLLGKSEETLAAESLIPFLKHADGRVRELVANAMTEIGDVRALQPLIDALKDPLLEVQEAASIALGELGDSRAVEPLVALLGRTDDQQVAASALAIIGDKRAVDPLIACFKEAKHDDMRAICIRSLGKFPSSLVLATVEEALDDPSDLVKSEAIKVLGEHQVLEKTKFLQEIYELTDSARLKLVCAVALSRLGIDSVQDHLSHVLLNDTDWGRRLNAMMGLLIIPSEKTLESLRSALLDEHWLIQKQAALSLVKLHDSDAYTVVQAYMDSEEEDLIRALIDSDLSILDDSEGLF